MSRYEKRKISRMRTNIINKGKRDMTAWLETITHVPSEAELKAWKDGYISGINRANTIVE